MRRNARGRAVPVEADVAMDALPPPVVTPSYPDDPALRAAFEALCDGGTQPRHRLSTKTRPSPYETNLATPSQSLDLLSA